MQPTLDLQLPHFVCVTDLILRRRKVKHNILVTDQVHSRGRKKTTELVIDSRKGLHFFFQSRFSSKKFFSREKRKAINPMKAVIYLVPEKYLPNE